ncbi:two-component system cell cycle sensor histidine kinase PleC [Azospirillum fermentarium]|uniref:ATP-binding protein n=1 Tax=Azospirillum fermentarium TaxID=1233114 RepID=UPI002225CB73|nr:hybrid sensor histidine kinase/response regulator [Azospirillum fermentarium]MCW2246686.1 two-component system cell cycle sensor histidine kinase PleC [Azospirillum fermentarium]
MATTHMDEIPFEPAGDRIRRLEARVHELEAERLQMRSALALARASEGRIRLIADSIPALVAYFDGERRCRYANRIWQEWFGALPLDAGIEGIPALTQVAEGMAAALKGEALSFETDVECADTPRRLALSFVPHRDGAGGILGAFLLGLDETERSRAQAALLDREELLNLAMHGANDGLWDWNPITKDLYLSARLLSIIGFDRDTVRTTTHEWLKLVHPDDRAHYEARVTEHLKGLTPHFEDTYRVAGPAGSYRWVLARGLALRRADGMAYRMVGSIADVTEIKRRETALAASEARFRSLIQAAGTIILVIGPDGCVQEANREAVRALMPEKEGETWRPGCAWQDLIPADGAFAQVMAVALSGQTIRNAELVWRTAQGEERAVLWNMTALPAPGGDGPPAIICAGQDITRRRSAELALRGMNDALEVRVAERTQALIAEIKERERAEAALLRAKEMAESASRSKSDFLANMSHELRTPLNAIIGFSSMMEAEMLGPLGLPKYQEYAGVIVTSGEHLLAVINDILDIAKIEAGKFAINPEPLNVCDAVEGCCVLVRDQTGEGGVEVSFACDGATPVIHADPVRVKQIVLNLLSNAVKFTPAPGEVHLSVGPDPATGGVVITVADTGIGMSTADLAVALEPFGQADNRLARRAGGTGLGLPLARAFTERHGGRLELESREGAGTTVRVHLPPGGPGV